MSDNVKVLVVGAGAMAQEYCKVLKALEYEPVVIGRGEEKAAKLEAEFGVQVLRGGIENNIDNMQELPEYAIVAVDVEYLAHTAMILLEHGVKNILLEKPAGITREEVAAVAELSREKDAKVYVAYNRRFYASVQKALEIIEEDGGVSSFHFEFTEWVHVFEKLNFSEVKKQVMFLGNSTHVIDLAFFLGGAPKEMSSYVQGELAWNKGIKSYAGAGVSEKGILFTYQSNWSAPGRWAVEVLTDQHRLYFKPMEKLQIQEKGSVAVGPVEIDDELDVLYKPGLYRQTESFLKGIEDGKKVAIEEQLAHWEFFEKIEGKL
ncbi:MAG: Gfo/Idh/MocA family oxidoreductase [Roseburia sp.]|nr:Gfo/Idh/MocA family oxidoreductase [Roseburia sp.]